MSIFNFPIKLVDSASYNKDNQFTGTERFDFAQVENFLFGHSYLTSSISLDSTGSHINVSLDEAFSGSDFTPWPDLSGVRTFQKSDLLFIKKENNEIRFYNFGTWYPDPNINADPNEDFIALTSGSNPTAFKLFCEQENLYYDTNQPLNWNSLYRMTHVYEGLKTNNRTDLLLVESSDGDQARLNTHLDKVKYSRSKLNSSTRSSIIRNSVAGNWGQWSSDAIPSTDGVFFYKLEPEVLSTGTPDQYSATVRLKLKIYPAVKNHYTYGSYSPPDFNTTNPIVIDPIDNWWREAIFKFESTATATHYFSTTDICYGAPTYNWLTGRYTYPSFYHPVSSTSLVSYPNQPAYHQSNFISGSNINDGVVFDNISVNNSYYNGFGSANLGNTTRDTTILPAFDCSTTANNYSSFTNSVMSVSRYSGVPDNFYISSFQATFPLNVTYNMVTFINNSFYVQTPSGGGTNSGFRISYILSPFNQDIWKLIDYNHWLTL